VKSCTTLAVMADGHEVKTIEGAGAGWPRRCIRWQGGVFASITVCSAASCTPGMIMTAVDLVHRKGHDLFRPGHSRRTRRQSVPLYRLSEHRRFDRRGRQGDGELGPRVNIIATPRSGKFSCTNSNIIVRRRFDRPPTFWPRTRTPKLIAGGHTLVPVMKQRLASPRRIWSISPMSKGLDTIEMKGRSLVIGATGQARPTVRRDPSATVGEAIPALAELAGHDRRPPRVRHRGTIGGLARQQRSDRGLSGPPALRSALTIVTNKRPAESRKSFFPRACSRPRWESDEIITKVMFPLPKKAALRQIPQPGLALTRWSACSWQSAPSDVRVCRHLARGLGTGVFRVTSFEEALKKAFFSHKVLDGISVPGGRAEQRPARQRRVSRASDRRHDAPRRRKPATRQSLICRYLP